MWVITGWFLVIQPQENTWCYDRRQNYPCIGLWWSQYIIIIHDIIVYWTTATPTCVGWQGMLCCSQGHGRDLFCSRNRSNMCSTGVVSIPHYGSSHVVIAQPCSMDGFKVVKLEDVSHFVDIVITCTGEWQFTVITWSLSVSRWKTQYHKKTIGKVKKRLYSG